MNTPLFIAIDQSELEGIELGEHDRVRDLRARLKPGAPDVELHIFAEDGDEPLDEDHAIDLDKTPVLHASRCRKISVTVAYLDRIFERDFAPGTTIAKLTKWATHEAKLGKEEAEEHVLQIAGTRNQPSKTAHLGTLATTGCAVAFELVRKQLVQG
jgi:hypothetical protein